MNNLFFNNLKIAIRSLSRHRLSAVVNIAGLAVGMAACLVITLYVERELSFDAFYQDADQVYRLTTYMKQEESNEHFATTPPPLAPMLSELSPEVLSYTRMSKRSDFTMRPDHDFERPYRETNAWTVDPGFVQVLNGGVLAGDPETMLANTRSVVMPRATAIRYFGQEAFDQGNIVGRELGGGGDGGTKWKVTGVVEDQPENSHLSFDMLLSPGDPTSAFDQPIWSWLAFYSYVKLKDDAPATVTKVKDQLEYIVANHAVQGEDIESLRAMGLDLRYELQPITDIHLKSALLREMGPNGNLVYVRSMIMVAAFIMLLACVNFINLSTARSTVRAKEVGVRKVLGSYKGQLVLRFLTESLVMTGFALVLAFGLMEFMLFVLKNNLGWTIGSDFMREPTVFMSIIGMSLLVGIAAGIYPALYLTRFRPVQVLKGKDPAGRGGKLTRNLLVSVQFVISIALIIGTLIINNQVDYIQQKDLGFDKENVLVVQNDREVDERRQEFKIALRNKANVIDASFSTGIPGLPQYMRRDFTVDGRADGNGISWFQADDSFFTTLDVNMLEGRSFENGRTSDSTGIILNQQAVAALALENPVGTFITINKGDNDARRVQVIGVMEDFNFQSFDRGIAPLAIEYLGDYAFKDYISIRLAKGNVKEAVAQVEAVWKEFEPNVPIVHSFLDNDFDQLFKSEQRLGKIFNAFSGLAIFIACLGLFGLAAYTNEQRTREISIRKVLGATIPSLLALLYKGYFKIIMISFVISAALAYGFATEWLSGFVYHAPLSAAPFVLALVGTAAISALTIVWQSLRTVTKNPAETLKNE